MTIERSKALAMASVAVKSGGFTYSAERGTMIDPGNLAHGTCAVSLPGFEVKVPVLRILSGPYAQLARNERLEFIASAIMTYANSVENVRRYNGAHIGGWLEYNRTSDEVLEGYLVLDVTVLVKREDAVAQCVAWGQRAYYDFERQEVVNVEIAGR